MGLAALAAVAAAAALAPLPQTFADRAGDAGGGPDLTAITVSEPEAGVVELAYQVAGLTAHADVTLYLDVDRNVETGSFSGSEYSVEVGLDAAGARRWRVTRWQDFVWAPVAQPASAGLTVDGDTWRVRAAIPGLAAFDFYAVGELLGDGGHVLALDYVPDVGGLSYEAKTPPTPRASGRTPRIGAPTLRRSGVRVAAGFPVAAATAVSCEVRLGGRSLKHTTSFDGSRATCALVLPRGAAGQTLRLTLTARGAAGTSARRSATLRVR